VEYEQVWRKKRKAEEAAAGKDDELTHKEVIERAKRKQQEANRMI